MLQGKVVSGCHNRTVPSLQGQHITSAGPIAAAVLAVSQMHKLTVKKEWSMAPTQLPSYGHGRMQGPSLNYCQCE